jgi:tRNA A-37 threonylcarbamoyl transferase component Bud32
MSFASAVDSSRSAERSASDLFAFWQTIGEHAPWVEEPNERRRGISGVRRVQLHGQEFFVKIQIDHCHRSFRHPLGRPTALREAEALEACHRQGIHAPQIEFCATRKAGGRRHTLLVTRGLSGFIDLERFLQQSSKLVRGQERRRLIEAVASTCARLHRARWQHSALYSKHIFVGHRAGPDDGQFDVALIDLEKARRRLSCRQASRHDLDQLKRHCNGFDANDWQHFTGHYQRAFAEGVA